MQSRHTLKQVDPRVRGQPSCSQSLETAFAMNRLPRFSSAVNVLVAHGRTSGACCSIGHSEYFLPDLTSQRRQYSGTESSSEDSGRYGSQLLRSGKLEQFNRMRAILGIRDEDSSSAGRSKPKRVTISIFQSMKYLFGPEYKQDLAAYRVKALGRQLHPLLQRTNEFLDEQTLSAQHSSDAQKAAKPKKVQ